MYLLYLDWNAIGGLRGTPSGDFATLASLLTQHRDRFWIPYSSTHLDDLARGYDPVDEKKRDYTYRDLAFIGQLTKGACFQIYEGKEKPEPDRRDPVEFFESHYAAQQDSLTDLLKLANSPSDTSLVGVEGLLGTLLDLPMMPFPEEGHGTPFAEMFPDWSTQGTLRGFLKDWQRLMTRANTDYTYSKELQSLVRTGIPSLDPRVISSAPADKAFEKIEEVLAPFMGGRSVIDMMNGSLKNHTNPAAGPTLQQQFVQAYYQLQLLNYHPDELKAKNHFPNILGDAVHAFLAGHCDFLITNDKDLRHKAKAVYQKIPTNTRVVSVKEFVELIPAELVEYTPQTYGHYILGTMQSGQRIPEMCDESAMVEGYLLSHRLFDSFNAYEVIEGNTVSFFRIETTYRHFTFSTEIKQLVSLISTCLGADDTGRVEVDFPAEMHEIEANTWAGRQWTRQASIMNFTCQGGEPRFSIKLLSGSFNTAS